MLLLAALSCAALASAAARTGDPDPQPDPLAKCRAGLYGDPRNCTLCPAHHYCTGGKRRLCPPGSDTDGAGYSQCAVGAGYYWRWDADGRTGGVRLCERGHYCEGGFHRMEQCPAGTHCARGCRAAAQCT